MADHPGSGEQDADVFTTQESNGHCETGCGSAIHGVRTSRYDKQPRKNNGTYLVKKYLRTGLKATLFLALAGLAVWCALVLLLVYRAD